MEAALPERLLSQLAHVEIVTPAPEESLRFCTEVLGLEHSGTFGGSAYLRGWGEFFHHSLQLTEGDQPGLGHIAWRAEGTEQLETAVARIEASGAGEGWFEGSTGHGPAYRYRSPGGHLHEIFWEVERFKASPELVSPFPNRPQRYVPRGAALRCLDHVTVATADPETDANWLRDTLGHRYMEYTVIPDRPDFVESSDVVGKGRVQLETSVAWERDRAGAVKTRLASTPTLLRIGTGEDWELRFETDGRLRLRTDEAGVTTRQNG